ncbi:tRNA (adenosine(37)-N6)-threonylcarbamoyltransferase complex dimerization subunit type 1 TsaB [Primorskyibacter sp. S187A]|uniref:tRNA (adenosine(37)-N6)-threonylcarbamoyltransferase complex dimerization subunit type 1 TsaB n=1 Tax=Primorskyibacter sp. S187A TaxID=3415130 RepID=UPI003C7DA897
MTKAPLVLGFDTSAAHCAAALLSGDTILAQQVDPMERGQAERLVPFLASIITHAGHDWSDLTALGVGTGPGNFTGIRISVALARGLSLSLGIPAVGVSALEAAAFGLPRPVTSVLDARRGRLYTQRFPDGAPEMREDLPAGPLTGGAAPEGLAQHTPLAEAIARIAATRFETASPPKPLYLRAPDAAPAKDRGPILLDDV